MAKDKIIQVKIIKGLCGLGYGYIINNTEEIPEDLAIEFINKGYAVAVENKQEPAAKKTDLPKDLPGLDLLLSEGLNTQKKVKEFKDLTNIKGIGAVTAAEILQLIN